MGRPLPSVPQGAAPDAEGNGAARGVTAVLGIEPVGTMSVTLLEIGSAEDPGTPLFIGMPVRATASCLNSNGVRDSNSPSDINSVWGGFE